MWFLVMNRRIVMTCFGLYNLCSSLMMLVLGDSDSRDRWMWSFHHYVILCLFWKCSGQVKLDMMVSMTTAWAHLMVDRHVVEYRSSWYWILELMAVILKYIASGMTSHSVHSTLALTIKLFIIEMQCIPVIISWYMPKNNDISKMRCHYWRCHDSRLSRQLKLVPPFQCPLP